MPKPSSPHSLGDQSSDSIEQNQDSARSCDSPTEEVTPLNIEQHIPGDTKFFQFVMLHSDCISLTPPGADDTGCAKGEATPIELPDGITDGMNPLPSDQESKGTCPTTVPTPSPDTSSAENAPQEAKATQSCCPWRFFCCRCCGSEKVHVEETPVIDSTEESPQAAVVVSQAK